MIIELLQQMEAGRRKQARFTQGVELQKPSCMEDSPTEDPGPMKVAEAVMLRVLGCVADLTFLRQDSVVEGPGKAPGLQKPEPWQEEELKEEEWKEEEWKEEDWDEEGNWVGEPAVPVPESGEEDWYENDTLDEFRSDGGEPYGDEWKEEMEEEWPDEGQDAEVACTGGEQVPVCSAEGSTKTACHAILESGCWR